ncbi:MAG TPA: hypothetical protein VH442_08220 [Micromonosporaceae bacterium]
MTFDLYRRTVAGLMTLEAASLAVVSAIHLSRSEQNSGIPEAVIGIVLAAAATAVYRGNASWRPIALGAVGFAIAGFLLGLSITASSGTSAGDIAYHATTLPFLIATFIIALRARPAPTAPTIGSRRHRRSANDQGGSRRHGTRID